MKNSTQYAVIYALCTLVLVGLAIFMSVYCYFQYTWINAITVAWTWFVFGFHVWFWFDTGLPLYRTLKRREEE